MKDANRLFVGYKNNMRDNIKPTKEQILELCRQNNEEGLNKIIVSKSVELIPRDLLSMEQCIQFFVEARDESLVLTKDISALYFEYSQETVEYALTECSCAMMYNGEWIGILYLLPEVEQCIMRASRKNYNIRKA